MLKPELHFSFDHWLAALLVFVPLALNAFLFVYSFFYFRHNKLTRVFYVFLLALCLTQLSDLMVRLSADKETAAYWYFILSPALNLIPPLGLHFALVFTRKKVITRSYVLICLLYLPTFVFRFLTNFGAAFFDVHRSGFWGWLITAGKHPAEQMNAFWNVLLTITMIILLAQFYRASKHRNKTLHIQARLVLLGFVIPSIITILTEFVFPFFLGLQPIPMLSATLSFFAICVIVALKNHELLTYSPLYAWPGIINNMNEGLLIVNNKDEIQFANRHFCSMTGYTERELLNKEASGLFLDDHEKLQIDSKIQARRANGSDKYQLKIRKKNGEIMWCAISGFPYYDREGTIIGSISLHTDITEQKKIEMALIESEAQLRFFVEGSPLSIYIYDPSLKKITWANKAFLDLFGYTLAELGNIDIYKWAGLSKNVVDTNIEDVIRTRKFQAQERRWETKDGRGIDVLFNTVCIKSKGEDVFYVSAQDITKFKQLENSLNQKIKDLNIFIYQVSHDIKGPLSSILGLATIADKETNDANQKTYLDMISESTKRLNRTLEDLLDIIVVTQGKLRFEPVHIAAEIADIKKNLSSLPNFSRISIKVSVDVNETFISDKVTFNTVLQNLVANAINYADLKKADPYILIRADRIKDDIRIIIEDNGIGIPKESQEKIWDMFYRATDSSKGTGLGLFIVHNAVERLHGTISLESEPGKGSKFCVTFPATVLF